MATKKSVQTKTPVKAPTKVAAKAAAPKVAATKTAVPKEAVAKRPPVKAKETPKDTKKPLVKAKPPLAKAAPKAKVEPEKPIKATAVKPKPAKVETPKPVAKTKAPQPAKPKPAKTAKAEEPPKAAVKAASKAEPKSAAKVEPKSKGGAKANGAAVGVAVAVEKPAKPVKPPKLAPVAAAFAKTPPAKPMAVAAGRAQPVLMAPLTAPIRQPARSLSAPKPVSVEAETVGELQAVPAFKAKAGTAKGMVLVGAVAGAFGVKGEVRLRAFTEKKDGVIAYGPLYGEDGKVLLKPKSWRDLKDGVAVVAPEVKTREDAEKLKGVKLYVPRANLPNLPPEKDEYYWVDLMGCRAETLDGAPMGEVVAVWNFGAGDILELRPPSGGQNVRISFSKANVPVVDPIAKRIVIDPPAPEPMEK